MLYLLYLCDGNRCTIRSLNVDIRLFRRYIFFQSFCLKINTHIYILLLIVSRFVLKDLLRRRFGAEI